MGVGKSTSSGHLTIPYNESGGSGLSSGQYPHMRHYEAVEPFGITSQRLYLSKFKSQNTVYQRGRLDQDGKEKSDFESVTSNKLGIYARLTKGVWSNLLRRHRYPMLSEEDSERALEFTLELKRVVKSKGKKTRETYIYDGVLIDVDEKQQQSSVAKIMNSSMSLSSGNRHARIKGYDNEEKPKNLQFFINRVLIYKTHPKWGSECVRILIESPIQCYYLPLLDAFQNIYRESMPKEESFGNSETGELLEIGCTIAKIVISYLPPVRARRDIDESKLDAKYRPDTSSIRTKKFRTEISTTAGGGGGGSIGSAHDVSKNGSSSLDRFSRSSAANGSSSLSETRLMQELKEGVREVNVDGHTASLTFDGNLILNDKIESDFLQWSKLTDKSEKKSLEALEVLQKNSESLLVPATRTRKSQSSPAQPRGSHTKASKSLVFNVQEVDNLDMPSSRISFSEAPDSALRSRRKSSFVPIGASAVEDFGDPSGEVRQFALRFENASLVRLYGKLPDVLLEHGFALFNFDTSLKAAQVKYTL